MTVYMTWHGGHSYAVPYASDREELASVAAARELFESRYYNRDGTTPAVDDTATAWLFFTDPADTDDPYPDRIVEIGPRGGIRVSLV